MHNGQPNLKVGNTSRFLQAHIFCYNLGIYDLYQQKVVLCSNFDDLSSLYRLLF
jgi:hypothetical protein